jgi:hypothetical protein
MGNDEDDIAEEESDALSSAEIQGAAHGSVAGNNVNNTIRIGLPNQPPDPMTLFQSYNAMGFSQHPMPTPSRVHARNARMAAGDVASNDTNANANTE